MCSSILGCYCSQSNIYQIFWRRLIHRTNLISDRFCIWQLKRQQSCFLIPVTSCYELSLTNSLKHMLCKPLEPDERNILKGFCYWHSSESLSASVFLPVNISLPSPLPPSRPRVSLSVPALPPLHLPAENEMKGRSESIMDWCCTVLLSLPPVGPLGSVVYWCSSGTGRSFPLSRAKHFENKCRGKIWLKK